MESDQGPPSRWRRPKPGPEIIALIYVQRWIIEIFFRFFKQFLGGSHLISHCPNGIAIQYYCAMIACLLIKPGRQPKNRTGKRYQSANFSTINQNWYRLKRKQVVSFKAQNDSGRRQMKLLKRIPSLPAMILLGVNCGFGNHDCGSIAMGV